jgi:ABC-2 type transport system permease protein
MKRHFKIVFAIAKNCLIRIMEFRSEVISWTFFSVFWAFLWLAFVHVIFSQVTTIAGWNEKEVLILFTVQEIFIGFMWIFILPGVLDFSRSIRKGELDFLLLKPINTRFLLTFRRFEFDQYARIGILSVLLWTFVNDLNTPVGVFNLLTFLTLFFLGAFIFYSLFFAISISCFWFIDLFNLEDFFDGISGAGRYPITVFRGGARFLFSYVIPLGFIATFPVQALLGRLDIIQIPVAIFTAVVFFVFSQWFWNFALKRYSSASS